MKLLEVLVVDDDASVLAILTDLIRRWGHRPVAFDSFEDARAFLATSAPDAVVADVRLGKYNGLQLIHLVKVSHPQAALVALSGFDDPVLRAVAVDVGAAYVLKPLELFKIRTFLTNHSGQQN